MADWTLKLQTINEQSETSVVEYIDDGGVEGEGSLRLEYTPDDEEDAVNKDYVDNTLTGAPASLPGTAGTFFVYDSDGETWQGQNIADPVFNASRLQTFPLDVTGINDGYIIQYDAANVKFIMAAVPAPQLSASKLYGNPTASTAAATEIALLSSLFFNGAALGVTPSVVNTKLAFSTTTTNIASSTSVTTLKSSTIAANTLAVNGQELRFKAWGTYQAAASSLTLNFIWGGGAVYTLPTATLLGGASTSWVAEFTLRRTSSSGASVCCQFFTSDATSFTPPSSFVTTGYDFTVTNTFGLTAATTASASISAYGHDIYLQ